MTARRFTSLILVGCGVIGIIVVCLVGEPRYRGRTLTSWLQQCSDTPLMETERLEQAQAAVRAIGPAKALPRLTALVSAKEDSVSPWIIETSQRLHLDFLHWRSAEDLHQLGIAGFEALGTNGAPAVDRIMELLDDEKRAFGAVRCLINIGKPAEAALCRSLTNEDSRVRRMAVVELAAVTDDVDVYLDRLTNSLHDADGAIRSTAVQCIGAQTEVPERVIPILVGALNDPAEHVAVSAAAALADFGTNALSTFPAVSNVVQDAASPNIANRALNTLVSLAPDRALPLVLAGVTSTNSQRRCAAFGIMCNYPIKKPEIQAAIEKAVDDGDVFLARMAKVFLTEQRQRNYPEEYAFTDEPSYGGRPLGDWLQMRGRDSILSEEAQNAVRQMGSNGIAALFTRLAYKRPPFSLPAPDINMQAMAAFIALTNEALPALPRLQVLMDSGDADLALRAMVAACATGTNAVPLLIKGMRSPHVNVRSEAASFLSQGAFQLTRDQHDQVVAGLKEHLNDPDPNVRFSATNRLREFAPQLSATLEVK